MNNAHFKPSLSLSNLINDDLREDYERFTLFLEAYYEWLQSTTIEIENLSGTFSMDEVVVGAISGADAIIKQVSTGKLIVELKSRIPFEIGETITGETSSATCKVSSVTDNVIRSSGELLNYRNVQLTVDKYVDYLKSELYSSLPSNIEANKRFIARKFRDFYKIKGNKKSYQLLFRTLFNEDVFIKYPGEELLRVSDGKFEKTQIIRAVVENESTIFDYLNQTITGQTSDAIGNVVDIKLFNVGSVRVAEMTLKLVSGVFNAGERIEIVGTETTNTAIYGMVTGFTINDAGSGYAVGDTVIITSGEGNGATAVVSSIQKSPITKIKVNTPGYGYRLNTEATINNSGTGGTGLIVRVTDIANTYSAGGYTVGETATISIISRGSNYFKAPTITLTDSVISSLGMLSDKLIQIVSGGTNYAVGDALVFTGGSGGGAAGNVASVSEATTYDLLFEDGFRMTADGSYYDIVKNEDWNVTGSITRLELTNFGTAYTISNLPTISVTSGTGSSANLISIGIQGSGANVSIDVANNATGIGSIRKISLTNFGVGYVTANVNLSGIGDGNANVSAIITGLGINDGGWINDDGKIDYKLLQDSEYYQDFSYVIRSGLEFNLYSDIVKQIIHPAGLQFFGEILITTELDVSPVFKSTLELATNVNKYIAYMVLKGNAAVSPSYRSLNVEIDVKSLIQTQTAIYNRIERLISFQSEIDVSPIISSVIDIISNVNEFIVYINSLINTQSLNTFTERQIKIHTSLSMPDAFEMIERLVSLQPKINVSPIISSVIDIISSINEFIVYLQSLVSTESLNNFTERQIKIHPFSNVYEEFSPIAPNLLTIGETPISVYSSNLISEFQSLTFNDTYGTGLKTVRKNTKVSGTVDVTGNTVSGTSTTLNTDFANGDSIIIGNEKFIVNSVANTNYLLLNVSAQGSYTGASAYKEALVY